MAQDDVIRPDDSDLDEAIAQHLKDVEKGDDPDKDNPDKDELKGDEPKGDEPKGDEPKGDEPKSDDEPDKDKGEEPREVGIEDFNKALESEFLSVDDLKEAIKVSKEVEALRKSSADWEAKFKKKEDLLKKYSDPLSHFRSEDEYKRQQLLIKRPDLNPSIAGELFSKDLDKLDDMDAVILHMQLQYPNLEGGEQGAKDLLYDKYNIDPETPIDEWSSLTKNQIRIAGAEAKKFLSEVKSDITLPETIDFEAEKAKAEKEAGEAKQKLTDAWTPITTKMMEKLDKLTLSREDKDGKTEAFFEYEIDLSKEDRETVAEKLCATAVKMGMELTEENIKALGNDVLDQYFLLNRNKILQAYADQELAKLDAKWRKETDNPSLLRDDEPPEESDTEKRNREIDEEVSKELDDF